MPNHFHDRIFAPTAQSFNRQLVNAFSSSPPLPSCKTTNWPLSLTKPEAILDLRPSGTSAYHKKTSCRLVTDNCSLKIGAIGSPLEVLTIT